MTQNLTIDVGRRYQIFESIGQGGMGEVFRARDRLTGQIVALKSLLRAEAGSAQGTDAVRLAIAPGSDSPAPTLDIHLALAREFRTLSSLRHPHIISVLDYGFDAQRMPFFTMELLPLPQTLLQAAADQPRMQQVQLLAQLLRALAYLHRRGILHRDIKPSNVLCLKGQVKVVDFGISSSIRGSPELAGTLEYMAPELLLGHPPSPGSDLYAVGVMFYQIWSGCFPYSRDSISRMVADVLGQTNAWQTLSPNILALLDGFFLADAVPSGNPATALERLGSLAPIILRLLDRRLEVRYNSVVEVLADLARVVDQDLPIETEATRESFLVAAELVGRDAELARLQGALGAARAGRGGVWLISGESGVGKSRLIDELRSLALVQGVRVLRGQAVSDGKSGLAIYTEALRALVLETELSELEAGVLKGLVPDLEGLLERPVVEAPVLDAQGAGLRLRGTMETVLFRLNQPTLLILEDLHWAAPDSLEFLRRLVGPLDQRPLLVVGTYRNDERADLPQEIAGAVTLHLGRLGRESVTALSWSMLGEAGKNSALVDLIIKESEGNAYFIVEVVRALAEEAGSFGGVGLGQLPRSVVAGGMQAVLQRRLGRVHPAAQRLLRLCAVAGRQVDLKILSQVSPASDLEAFLRDCAEAAVLEVSEQRWRFSHDKLRERLLTDLDKAERRDLHKQVAEGVEHAYPAIGEHAAALAYHYEQAGVLDRAAHYAVQAGEQALQQGALAEAAAQFERGLQLHQQIGSPRRDLGRTRRLLSSAHLGLGQLVQTTEVMHLALADLGDPMPHQLKLALLRQLGQQALHRGHPRLIRAPATPTDAACLSELISQYKVALECFAWEGKALETAYCVLKLLNLGEQLEVAGFAIAGYSTSAFLFSMTPLKAVSRYYAERSQALLGQVDEAQALYAHRALIAGFLPQAELLQARDHVEQALRLARKVGDQYALMFVLMAGTQIQRALGDYERARVDAEELLGLASRSENTLYQCNGLAVRGTTEQELGQFTVGFESLAAGIAVAERVGRKSMADTMRGAQALSLLQQGDWKGARDLADKGLVAHQGADPTTTIAALLLMPLAITYLELWRTAPGSAERLAIDQQIRQTIHEWKRVEQLLARPGRLLIEGRYAFIHGKTAAAQRSFRKGAQVADGCGMRHQAALARAWLGRVTPGWPGRLAMESAKHSLHALGAQWDAAEVTRWLADRSA